MENNTNTIHFRKTTAGDLISVTEQNTKITYTIEARHEIGRLVIEYDRVALRQTAAARFRYFMYNNRLARAKRAVEQFKATIGSRIYNRLARRGLRVYVGQ